MSNIRASSTVDDTIEGDAKRRKVRESSDPDDTVRIISSDGVELEVEAFHLQSAS